MNFKKVLLKSTPPMLALVSTVLWAYYSTSNSLDDAVKPSNQLQSVSNNPQIPVPKPDLYSVRTAKLSAYHYLLLSTITLLSGGFLVFKKKWHLLLWDWICKRTMNSHISKPRKSKGFLNNTANHCFANALLVCLIQIPDLQKQVKYAASKSDSPIIVKKLAALFDAIRKSPEDYTEKMVNRKKEELFQEVITSNPEIPIFYGKGGDSRSLLQVICQNLYLHEYSQDSEVSCFSVKQHKTVTCQICIDQARQIPKEYMESAFMLDIQEEYYFKKKSPDNFFQSEAELRKCRICEKTTSHRKDFTLSFFPEALAIRISENGNNIYQPTGESSPHQTLVFNDSKEGKQVYRFVGGVYNTNKGYDGVHSVAYIDDKTRGLLCYDDSLVTTVGYDQIRGYPKLLFYVKESMKVMEICPQEEVLIEGGKNWKIKVGNN